ncbi:2340_t:CDS:2 [Paraglomus brasilianum]|uniref:Methylthioribose-1-phosphate isomerase n=1 Tax=Paraglomus brasilianum TaxID=144538 RepID=A0A9N9DZP0_9GLOM|nr:2340_t:CDS:2 [Paraglomus brasilianum]
MSSLPLESIIFTSEPISLKILNQLLLPHETTFTSINSIEDGHTAIKTMQVRGAPAIGIVAALTLAVDLVRKHKDSYFRTPDDILSDVKKSLDFLRTARPTAVNLFRTVDDLSVLVEERTKKKDSIDDIIEAVVRTGKQMLRDDQKVNTAIGSCGADYIYDSVNRHEKKMKILTHCNTGSLATGGYGTALGIIRSLYFKGHLMHAYFTETRPYNQGARLTAYELLSDDIPSTMICDSMAAALMSKTEIDAIVLGADRVARNGDTANKIGTCQLAIVAKYYGVKFIVAAPTSSIDLNTLSGKEIIIEERSGEEVVKVAGLREDNGEYGKVLTTPRNVNVWNPSFDVTPATLITAIVTEYGIITKNPDTNEFPDLAEILMKLKATKQQE